MPSKRMTCTFIIAHSHPKEVLQCQPPLDFSLESPGASLAAISWNFPAPPLPPLLSAEGELHGLFWHRAPSLSGGGEDGGVGGGGKGGIGLWGGLEDWESTSRVLTKKINLFEMKGILRC